MPISIFIKEVTWVFGQVVIPLPKSLTSLREHEFNP